MWDVAERPPPAAEAPARPPAAPQVLALQRTVGNRAVAQLVARSKSAEALFAVRHPFAAAQIYGAEDAAEVEIPSTSSLAVRFSVNLRTDRQPELGAGGLTENASREGSEVNAVRHTLWNAINASRFGVDTATEAANSHEDDPNLIDNQDPATQTFASSSLADSGVDLRNNIIGRAIGNGSRSTPKQLTAAVLRTFHDQGLYVSDPIGDGTFRAVRRTISDATFQAASAKLANFDEIGLPPAAHLRWQAAHDERMRAALEDAMSGLHD